MTKIYFTSDWHIGHANIITFDQRPFKDLDHMHRVLVNNYNASVSNEDTCYFLGDIGLCKSETVQNIVKQLNGLKVLVLGNHDKGHTAMRKIGFDLVLNTASLEIGGKHVTMSHCPLKGVYREDTVTGELWHGEQKHHRYSLPDFGQYHLHGHIHSGPANTKPRYTYNQFDVGVAANDYRPVSMSTIESWIALSTKVSAK